ncbi:MAG: hypothetical protein U0638_03080 [Phycisphaerales bacterium]
MARNRIARVVSAAGLLALSAGHALGQSITVTTADDIVDFGGGQTYADLPGPDGLVSLSEAGIASDNTPGVQTIAFHVPQSQWQYQWLYPGRAVVFCFGGLSTSQPVIVDGTTQTAFTGDTNPSGAEVVIWNGAYIANNIGGAVLGLDSTQFQLIGGSGNLVQGNSNCGINIYESTANLIGGSNPAEGNTGGGTVQIIQSRDNVIVGNTLDRIRIVRWSGNVLSTNNRIGGPTPGERNRIVGMGSWNSQGSAGGFAIEIFDAQGTIIENNQIGTTPDGMSVGHLAVLSGIYFNGEHHNTTIRNNTIAGILSEQRPPHTSWYRVGYAIQISGTGSGVFIKGNKFGFDANGDPLLGSTNAILTVNQASPVSNIVIGGTAPGEANEIAGQLGAAIIVANAFDGVRITGNSFHDNAGLAIDLVTSTFQYGVTPNDSGDADTGGNGLQNFPVLTSATSNSSGTLVEGTLNSNANKSFTIEFFANQTCDASGYGEGSVFLGSAGVTTNASGNASFSSLLPVQAPAAWYVTATATQNASGSTSEFSACVAVQGGGCPADFNGDGFVNGDDYDGFASAFDVADLAADFNRDGFVNGDDYDAFASAFDAGC